jgi:hypothetical protein
MNISSTAVSPNEAAAFSNLMARVEQANAPKAASCKALTAISRMSKDAGISTSEIFLALEQGATEKGEQLLFKVLHVYTRYISAWGALAILVLGSYQLIQTTTGAASWIFGLIKRAGALASALGPITTAFSGLFHDAESDGDPSSAMRYITGIMSAEVPAVGGLLKLFETGVGSGGGKRTSKSSSGGSGWVQGILRGAEAALSNDEQDTNLHVNEGNQRLPIAYDPPGDADEASEYDRAYDRAYDRR